MIGINQIKFNGTFMAASGDPHIGSNTPNPIIVNFDRMHGTYTGIVSDIKDNFEVTITPTDASSGKVSFVDSATSSSDKLFSCGPYD